MTQQTYLEALREGRPFYRRRLVERLARAQMLKTGHVNVEQVVDIALRAAAALSAIEESEVVAPCPR